VLDSYNRTARLGPAFLAALPALAFLAAGITSPSTVLRLVGLVGGGLGLVLATLVRDRGRSIQARLWDKWGGPPAARRLRWTEGTASEVARLHTRVERATGLTLPDSAEEHSDTIQAEARYEEAVAALRELTRDRERFRLVFEENLSYGWHRNCYGVRPIGITIAGLTIIGATSTLLLANGTFAARAVRWTPALAISVLALAWWAVVVSEGWVRKASDTYTDRLYEATHTLTHDARRT
jgi:hypothetical protein